MRTVIPTVGGLATGQGLWRLWCAEYKIAVICMTVSMITYAIGYMFEVYISEREENYEI